MRLNSNILQIDIKVQDRYRKWFASLGTDDNLASTCVILGDSDVDYELSGSIEKSKIISAPFASTGVKHKLIYNGVGKNLSGLIKTFVRKVTPTGDIQSLYNYPTDSVYSTGVTPPVLENGKDWEAVVFDDSKMGMIFYFSTILDYYVDDNGIKKRLIEQYDFSVDWNGTPATPANWEYVIDNDNGSLILMKNNTTGTPIGVLPIGKIKAIGKFSKKVKEVQFNF